MNEETRRYVFSVSLEKHEIVGMAELRELCFAVYTLLGKEGLRKIEVHELSTEEVYIPVLRPQGQGPADILIF